MRTNPIFHLSLPVRDLEEAVGFYTGYLGATVGRRTQAFVDVFLFGAQITLHNDVHNVTDPMPRTRHFGATLKWRDWEVAAERLAGTRFVVESPKASYVGEPVEQTKFMIADPSGNLIEIKAYRYPENVLGGVISEN